MGGSQVERAIPRSLERSDRRGERTKPRVRFVLRPTGQPGDSLTLAQARAALYNWLYARHEGGTFYLCVPEACASPVFPALPVSLVLPAVQPLCEELRWLGLDWEEAPQAGLPERIAPLYRSARYQRYASQHGERRHPDPLLARVAADHEMAITHVIRDAPWQPQMEQELSLYRALGWEPPRYLHLPPIAMPEAGDRAVHPQATLRCRCVARVASYRARGYLPLALANHLARLGWTPRGKRELLSLEELAGRLDLARLARRPIPFDLAQLNWFNRRALCALDAREVTALLLPRWQATYGAPDRATGTALSPLKWRQALALALRPELDHLDQVAARARFAFVDQVTPLGEARAALSQPYALEVLRAFVDELPGVEPFTYAPIDAWISALRQRFKAALGVSQGVRSRDVMYVLRAALTGRMEGPCLVEVCQLLGVERCAERAHAAMIL